MMGRGTVGNLGLFFGGGFATAGSKVLVPVSELRVLFEDVDL